MKTNQQHSHSSERLCMCFMFIFRSNIFFLLWFRLSLLLNVFILWPLNSPVFRSVSTIYFFTLLFTCAHTITHTVLRVSNCVIYQVHNWRSSGNGHNTHLSTSLALHIRLLCVCVCVLFHLSVMCVMFLFVSSTMKFTHLQCVPFFLVSASRRFLAILFEPNRNSRFWFFPFFHIPFESLCVIFSIFRIVYYHSYAIITLSVGSAGANGTNVHFCTW